MLKLLVYILILKSSTAQSNGNSTKNFIYGQYSYNSTIRVFANNVTEQILDFYEQSKANEGYPTRLHVNTTSVATHNYPVFITVTQQKGMVSWELPMLVKRDKTDILLYDMARTLCAPESGPDINADVDQHNRPTIHVTTLNPENITVDMKLTRVDDFYVEINKEQSVNVTPSTPQYFYFSFDQNPWNVTNLERKGLPSFNYTVPKSVIVIIDSDDDLCATVSIQEHYCPVLDSERDVMFHGDHLTMTTKGGITLTQAKFPHGFYVVLLVKESDAECTGESETETDYNNLLKRVRMKNFRFRIIPTVSYTQYIIGATVLLAVVALVAAFVFLIAMPYQQLKEEEVLIVESEPGPSTAQPSSSRTALVADDDDDGDVADNVKEQEWTGTVPLTVARLTRAPPESLARRSDRYFWGALTMAVVYALPVVQLLFTYQQMVFQTGNQDLCYYNFLCAHPVGFLSDFNHVYSNVAYVILGAAFILRVRARHAAQQRQGMGIPQHYGLLYSMGLALCMEGFLSACYHLCPNKMNFQFDSSFMYMIAVLVMLKLYQNRHSDLIPSAHSTFMLLAVVMSIGVIGILFPSIYNQIFFTILHLLTCLILTLKIYYAGEFKMEASTMRRAWRSVRARGWGRRRGRGRGRGWEWGPAHRARAVLLALANALNWSFAIYTLCVHNIDLARELLAILMGNAILYTIFYVAMKLLHRERIRAHTCAYAAGAHAAWAAAAAMFVRGNTRWSETPAMSRRRNDVCTSLELFDNHDLWHVASATALFLSFNMLLTVDDALADTPRTQIATF